MSATLTFSIMTLRISFLSLGKVPKEESIFYYSLLSLFFFFFTRKSRNFLVFISEAFQISTRRNSSLQNLVLLYFFLLKVNRKRGYNVTFLEITILNIKNFGVTNNWGKW